MIGGRRVLAGRRAGTLALAGVLLLAAFLRLFELQYGQYGSDDERLWSAALRTLATHQLPLQGIKSSIGIGNGPFQVYLMLLPAAVVHSALAGAVAVALLNVVGVWALQRFAREFFGPRPALIAALLFAVNSWAIIFSRRMQAQDLLVPFQILFFWAAARWLLRGRWYDLVLLFLWLAILTQVYILGLMLLATAAIILGAGWRRVRPWPLLAGLALWGLLSYRYLLGIVLPYNSAFRGVSGGHASLDLASVLGALTMATHKGFQTIAGQAGSVFDSTAGIEAVLLGLEMALFAAGAGLVLLRLVRALRSGPASKARLYGLLLLWLLLPVALFARHSVALYPYYFTTVLPLPALFTGLLLDRWWPRVGLPLLTILVANALAMAGIFFAVIPGYYIHNDYGLPYQQTFSTAASLEALAAKAGVHRVYVDGDLDPSDVMSSVLRRAGLDVFWLDDYRSPEFAAPPVSDAPALYVTMAGDTDTAHFLRAHFAAQQRYVNHLPGEGDAIRAYVLTAAQVRPVLAALLSRGLGLQVGNGMHLDAFSTPERLAAGQRVLPASVSWTWPGGRRPADLQYTLFGHLINAAGAAVAEVDRPLLPSTNWLAGEEVVQWLDLPLPTSLPPGAYRLEIGVYDDFGAVRQSLVDGSGRTLPSGSLLLGPIVMAPPPPPSNPDLTPARLVLGNGITLQAYGWSAQGGQLELDLRWQATATPTKDYTVYVHVLNGAGKLAAQADGQPRGGAFPTSAWRRGDVVDDPRSVAVPPGDWTVEVGMYNLATLQRLPGGPLRFPIHIAG